MPSKASKLFTENNPIMDGEVLILSKYDPQFPLEKKGERIEARLTEIDNATKLRKGLAELHLTEKHIAQEKAEFAKRIQIIQKTNVLDTD